MKRCADWVTGTRSRRFNLAFSAGGEIMSFLLARWVDEHAGELFAGADPVATTLFLWHLSEEVEHKSMAFDVYEEIDGSKLRYGLAMVHGHGPAGLLRLERGAGHAARRRSPVATDDPSAPGPLGHQRRLRAVPGDAGVGAARAPP